MSTPYRVPILDTFDWQEAVAGRTSTPPGSPSRGDRYIVIPTASGAWTGQEGDIALCSNATGPIWTFITPTVGWVSYVSNETSWYFWSGTIWKKLLHKNSGSIDEMFIEVMG